MATRRLLLQHEQAPGGPAEHPQQPDHRLADQHRVAVGGAGRGGRPPVRHEPAELGAEPGQLGCVRRGLSAARDQQGLAKGSQNNYFCDFGCVVSASGAAVTV